MVRFFAGAAGVFLAVIPAIGQSYEVKADKLLGAPITLSVKYSPIDGVLKSISRQSGVDIEASGPMSAEKLTVFVKAVPCDVVLDRIASVLGAHWKNLSGMRLLTVDSADRTETANYLAAEDLVLRKKAEQEIATLLARIHSANDAPSDPGVSTGGSPLPVRNGRMGVMGNRAAMADQIGRLLEGASSYDMDDFWKGAYASVVMGQQNPEANNSPGNRRRPTSRTSGEPGIVYGRYDYFGTHSIQIGSSRFPIVTQRYNIPSLLRPDGTLAETKFGKSVLAWPKLDLDSTEDAYEGPINDPTVRKTGFGAAESTSAPTPEEAPLMTQSELLEKFFKLTQLPVIADGFRTSLPPQIPEPVGVTAIDWLTSLSSSTGCFIQIIDGVTTVRQGGFWRLKQYEIPESTLRPLEANATKLTLTDYATFFASLTPAQSSSFFSATPPKLEFQTADIVDSIPALRFLGTLNSNFPVNGRPVPLSELGSDSQNLAGQALAQSVLLGKLWSKTDPALTKNSVLASVKPMNVQGSEGTVSGISLQFFLPIGQTVEYQIPLKLGA